MTDLSEENLVETAKRLSKVRTHYKIAIPMLLILVGWMVYEMVNAIGIESPTVIEPAILDWVVSFIIFASFQSKIALYL